MNDFDFSGCKYAGYGCLCIIALFVFAGLPGEYKGGVILIAAIVAIVLWVDQILAQRHVKIHRCPYYKFDSCDTPLSERDCDNCAYRHHDEYSSMWGDASQ